MRSRPFSGPSGDRRRGRTRAALITAGQALFSQRPVDSVSIDEVVKAADVAKGSFYNYFSGKEDLAREIAARLRTFSEHCIDEANFGVEDAAARVARALCVQVRYAIERPQEAHATIRLFSGATLSDLPMNRGVTRDVRRGIDSGRFTGLSVQAAVLLVMGVISAGIVHAGHLRGSFEPTELTVALALGLLRSLGVPEADAVRVARESCDQIMSNDYALGDRC